MAPTALTPKKLKIIIDGNTFSITDRDQEAASLLRLANRDPHEFDLFLVKANGVEAKIRDSQIVNLKDGERFVTRVKLHFTIDGEAHKTYDDDQSAESLLRLAGVDPGGYDLARILPNGATESFSDHDIVQIKEDDEFVTTKHVGGVA